MADTPATKFQVPETLLHQGMKSHPAADKGALEPELVELHQHKSPHWLINFKLD